MGQFLDNNNVESENLLLRLLWSVLYLIVWSISESLIFILCAAQFLFCLISGAPNEYLQDFGRQLGQFMAQIVDYLSFSSNERPFPFKSWPDSE